MTSERRLPRATYRMQFGPAWTFGQAREVVPYLARLGVSHVYASPLLRARPGSHPYDVVDHSHLDPAIGSRPEFNAFTDALRAHGMGLIVDVVPNHMGIGGEHNRWWLDVLEYGPASRYAQYFDIDWDPATSDIVNRVLLPILEDQYGNVLEEGKLVLGFSNGAFAVRYYAHLLPIAPRTYGRLVRYALEQARAEGLADEVIVEMEEIALAADRLPPPDVRRPAADLGELREQGEALKERLAALSSRSGDARRAIEHAVAVFNGEPGQPRSFDRLDALLAEQSYRPAFWRVASEEINYRRFFDINELAALRAERDDVFEDTHRLIFELVAEGRVQGLRVDHPDGLREPARYFERLQERYREVAGPEPAVAAGNGRVAGGAGHDPALYVVAEKILSEGEPLPGAWSIHGTTGYDFLNELNGIFVDTGKRRAFDRIYQQFAGARAPFADLENTAKKMIMLVSFAGEVNTLGHLLDRIASENRRYRDFTRNAIIFAIREIIASLSVYRTYITEPPVSPRDRAYVEAAVRDAKRRNPRTAASLFDFVGETLLLDNERSFPPEDLPRLRDFVLRFQQITGPVMAKGVEDTAFYVFNRLVSLNEVGGDPGRFGSSVQALHVGNEQRRSEWPYGMLATATHDTKRGEDVRARINVLSEMPAEWRNAVMRWREMNAARTRAIEGDLCPDPNDEYLLYQTLVGAWPDGVVDEAFVERVVAYMQKATKEAKVRTSWVNPNVGYDEGMQAFVREALADTVFVEDVRTFASRVAYFGRINSLSQLAIKLASPGVPDVYQGTELWDLNLVDPDNRRQIDYGQRVEALESLCAPELDALALCERLAGDQGDPMAKLLVLRTALRCRGERPELFREGAYYALDARGAAQRHVCAIGRRDAGGRAIVVAPRLVYGLLDGEQRPPLGEQTWGETALNLPPAFAAGVYRDAFTGERAEPSRSGRRGSLRLADALRRFPVAMLLSE